MVRTFFRIPAIRELTTKYFSIGDNSNLSNAATKSTHIKLFKPYLLIEPPKLNKFLKKKIHMLPCSFSSYGPPWLFTCRFAANNKRTFLMEGWPYKISNNFFERADIKASVAQLDAPSDWRPGGRGFNPRRGRQHSFVEIDHEIFSTVILSLPLIQEGQLSVSGERMCTILVNRLGD